MIEVHSVPSRNYSNRAFTTNALRLGAVMSRANFWKALLRLEIESANAGAALTITYSMNASDGTYLGGSTFTYTAPGRYQVAFSRVDLDDNATLTIQLTLTGTMRLNITVYFLEKGEDILEWL